MSTLFRSTCAVLATLLPYAMATGAETLSQDAWPQWRGPQRDGRIAAAEWPADLSEAHLTASWSVPMGPGYSGPIVAGNRVFVTETRDEKYEVTRALDRVTGEQIWQAEWEGAMKVPFFAAANGSWIRATPALDGERLYVAGMKDILVCLDATSGELLWKVDFVAALESTLPDFGFSSSPLVVDDHVYVQAGQGFVKLDKRSGEIVWRTLADDAGTNGSAFSSPTYAVIAGVPQLVVQTRATLAGVAPDDGAVLWSRDITAFRGMNILTPTVVGDAVFTSSYGGRSLMLRISRDGTNWNVDDSWDQKSQGYMSSPVVVADNIYLHLRNQRFTCLDANTGEQRWTTKPFGKYWSIVANGQKLLALDENGELLLINASPEAFELIDRRQVADDAWAHVAVVGNDVFVRDLEAMKRFEWK
jgi:outer membrane protein assembly factor BamB